MAFILYLHVGFMNWHKKPYIDSLPARSQKLSRNQPQAISIYTLMAISIALEAWQYFKDIFNYNWITISMGKTVESWHSPWVDFLKVFQIEFFFIALRKRSTNIQHIKLSQWQIWHERSTCLNFTVHSDITCYTWAGVCKLASYRAKPVILTWVWIACVYGVKRVRVKRR